MFLTARPGSDWEVDIFEVLCRGRVAVRRGGRGMAACLLVALATVSLLGPPCVRAEDPRDPVIIIDGVPVESGLRTLLLQETLNAYHSSRDWFGAEIDGVVTVAWAKDRADLARRAGTDPGTVAGVAVAHRNLVVLNAQALASRPDRILTVLHHEISHLVFAAATSSAEVEPPRWLNEGIAMWRSGEWDLGLDYRTDHAALLRDASAAKSLMPMEELDASFPSGPFFHVAYAQSLSFVEWLLRRDGEAGLLRFIEHLNADEDPEPAFEAAYGISFAEAEQAWHSDLGGGWLGRLPSGQALINFAWGGLGFLVILRFAVVRWRFKRSLREDDELDRGGTAE